jgi:hypothetical protein
MTSVVIIAPGSRGDVAPLTGVVAGCAPPATT